MNGYASKSQNEFTNALYFPVHCVSRDVNGTEKLSKEQTIGRYTAISKSVTKRNGNTSGSYQPAAIHNHFTTLDHNRRAHSQQNVERTYAINTSQSFRNGFDKPVTRNDAPLQADNENSSVNGDGKYLSTFQDSKHYKSHSVSSTFIIHNLNNNSRPTGVSQSCGQASPCSTSEDRAQSLISPDSSRTLETRPQHHSFWLHQSEILLPTDRDLDTTPSYNKQQEKRTYSVTGLESNTDRSYSSLATLDAQNNYYNGNSSEMFYGNSVQINESNDYSLGPSHRKIQNMLGIHASQRRYPSDTTLNYQQRDGNQVYTSGSKPGPVTIPARSRSAQPSPGHSPLASPNSLLRTGEQEARSRITRSQQHIDMQRGRSSPPTIERQKISSFRQNGSEEDSESQILPSVREIIRQVEEMTRSNATTSTTDISAASAAPMQSAIPRYQRALSNRVPDHFARGGFQRQSGSSQRTPSAPQLRYTPMQAKFNSIATAALSARNSNVAPPVPPHGTARTKAIIGSFTRRGDQGSQDGTIQPQRFEVTANPTLVRKTEQLSNLPTDYQKLREAFIEQRREIQRLRKLLADKDAVISQLQNDIRLYEPWR